MFAMESDKRISEGYLEQQRKLHENPGYGVASIGYAPLVKELLTTYQFESLCDYGAGKQRLREQLEKLGAAPPEYYPYDPVFPEYGKPQPADLVCCIDVLEHIEMEYLDAVLAELRDLVLEVGFFTVHTGPALKTLPDGRNAHLIQQPRDWWLAKLREHFEIAQIAGVPNGFWVLVQPRGD